MLRHFLRTIHPRRRRWREHATLCFGLILVSLWLCAGCQPTAPRTPPAVEIPDTATPTAPMAPPVAAEHPATERPAETTPTAGSIQTGEVPPDDYYGDPLLWIPGIKYENGIGMDGFPADSIPVLPDEAEKLERIRQMSDELSRQWHRGELSYEEKKALFAEKSADIWAAGLSPLNAAKYLSYRGINEEYAQAKAAQAVTENPDSFEALKLWAFLSEVPEEQAEGFRRMLALRPNSVETLVYLGKVLANTNPREAIEHLEKANRLQPGSADEALGDCYRALGDTDKALAVYQRLLKRYPDWARQRIESLKRAVFCADDNADTPPPVQADSSPPAAMGEPAALETSQEPRFQQDPHTFSLTPWAPVVIPPAVKERERASYQHYEAKEISMDEHLENMYQLYQEHLDGVTFVRELARRHGPYAGKYEFYLEKLFVENPNDFETLLTWVHAGGREFDTYGQEKTAALRRLYEIDPNHPYVLHELALCIIGTQPEEALGYAQKAQQLEPRYRPYGVEGLCYFQLGGYQQALEAFKRAYEAAPALLKPAMGSRIDYVQRTLRSETLQQTFEKARAAGIPLMSRTIFVRH